MDKERQSDGSRVKKSQDYQVMGKYLEHTRRVFTVREILHIRAKIMRGTRISRIAEGYGVDYRVIANIFKEFCWGFSKNCPSIVIERLGHKNEPYYETEDEMLEEPEYSWESLSALEKEWYLQRTGNPTLITNKIDK